jgi:hypothetical protein
VEKEEDGENTGPTARILFESSFPNLPLSSLIYIRNNSMVDPIVQALVEKHSFLHFTERGKVHCDITGHDIPSKVELVNSHLGGTKFKKQKEWCEFHLRSRNRTS